MAISQIEGIRNVALVGHGAVGKTTLSDLMLFRAGVTNRQGSVDDGTSLLDVDDEERERKFSISSHISHFSRSGHWNNVIDTPGYPDFIGQTISALRGVETAVIVIAADSGIAVNTRKVFQQATQDGMARMILLNKLDHDNIDFAQVVTDIQDIFGSNCLPLNIPVGKGSGFKGVVSTLPGVSTRNGVVDAKIYGQQVIDAIVESDDALMEKFFNGETLTSEEIATGITKAMVAGTLIPMFCASARTGVGVDEFMDAMTLYAAAPNALHRMGKDVNGLDVDVQSDADGPLVGQVFKTRIDPFVSKLSYIRLFSGKLTKDSTILCPSTGKQLKIHNLFHVQGGTQEPVDVAFAGDIVAVSKVDDLHTGDTICFGNGQTRGTVILPGMTFPTPMIGLAVEPKSRTDQQKISGALHRIEEEDPTFKVTRESQTHEMVMQGMSELHLQIVQNRLQKRDKVDVITHLPKIAYRETIAAAKEGSYRHKKQSGGSGQFAEVHLRVSPLPQGIDPEEYFTKDRFDHLREYHYDPELNFAFVDRVSGGSVPNQFIPAVEKGVIERMTKGVAAGYQIQDVCVEIYFGKDHPVDSNETAFRMAGSMCFRNLFREARPQLLEPIARTEIYVPGEKLGDITSDLNSRRGRVEGLEPQPNGYQIITARVPVSEMTTYARNMSSITGGRGSFTLEMSHYEIMPPNEQQRVITAAQMKDEDE
ncbi:MAG: elongation factor G [Planctomycetota bacterium]